MTYRPEFEVGPKSPGAWKEIRRLEAENARLREDEEHAIQAFKAMENQRDTLLAALRNLVKDAQAAVDQDNPFLGQQLNDLSWNTIPAARAAISEVEGEK